MELTALALFLTSTPQALSLLPDLTTRDSQRNTYPQQETALHHKHAPYTSNLLIGRFADEQGTIPHLSVAA